MSDTDAKLNEYQWQPAQGALLTTTALPQNAFLSEASLSNASGAPRPARGAQGQQAVQQMRPPLRSHKSFPYSLGPSSRSQDGSHQDPKNTNAMADFKERVVSFGPQPTGNSALPQPSYGGSAPTSPVGRLTPNSPNEEQDDAQMEDEDMESDAAEEGEGEERQPRTAAEIRAQKRKMKRFRLTHNQTRFLMSEFARQAHPDAAHRERLSREIPGLSPRQVQVWFQNRRAKLKRLTTDDRESIMRSRALPAGFDMTQALHAPFGAPTPTGSTPTASPQTFAPYAPVGSGSTPGPLTLDTMRRPSQYQPYMPQYSSPTGVTPALGGFAFTPPQSATETLSPASAQGISSAFSFQPSDTMRRYPYGLQTGGQGGYSGHGPQVPRLHTHDRLTRPTGEAAGSPLRSSISYSGLNAGSVAQQPGERSSSFSEHSSYTHERTRQPRPSIHTGVGGSGPYGLGFSYSQIPSYQSSGQPQQSPVEASPQLPATLDQYRRNSSHVAGSSISYPHYASTTYAPAQIPQYSYYNTAYNNPSDYPSYQQMSDQRLQRDSVTQSSRHQQQQQQQQSYTPMTSQSQHFGPLMSSADQPQSMTSPGDNSDGGVPVNPPF
ncbi:uncharacterized protein LTR77_005448 [Saxophila tyrrhenica]|uniref:Homeobox domain-containing protein n=1 Tax=Saxophila tyrrhenica TaxID=1690608 RepID=A0AAV9PCJ4_9PEZI|nr:hypothetical protein LTR77_005448 [Saxophila tyrrhenica]